MIPKAKTLTSCVSGEPSLPDWLNSSVNPLAFSGTPTSITHLGLSTITVTAQDSFGESITATFTINVSSRPLTLSTATINHEFFVNKEFAYEIAFNNPNNGTLSYMITVTGPASSGWLTVSTNNTTVSFSGTPTTTAHLGLSTITVIANDPFGESTSTAFTINIPNRPPMLNTPFIDMTAFTNTTFSYTISDAFTDPDNGPLSYEYTVTTLTASINADWLMFSSENLTFSGMPRESDIGDLIITITVTDTGIGSSSVSDDFKLSITEEIRSLQFRIKVFLEGAQ